MTDVATAKSARTTAVKPVAPAPAPAAPAQTLREVQIRKLPMERFKPVGHYNDPQQAMLKAEWDFEDVLNPYFWSFVAPSMQANISASIMQDKLGTLIHIHTEDHAFYGVVLVHGLHRNSQGQADALAVTCIGPVYDPETGKCHPVDVKTGGIWKGRKAKAG
jgi:hypothetical protein